MFTRSELLRMSRASEDLLDYSTRMRLVPSPDKILWLNAPPQRDCFPDYVLADLLRISYLHAYNVSSPWELKNFLLGGEGVIRYETDFNRLFGKLFYLGVDSGQGKLSEKLYQMAQDSFRPQKMVSATFRVESIKGRSFLILSRAVLQPKEGFFQLELRRVDSKEYQRRLTEAYKIIMKGRHP